MKVPIQWLKDYLDIDKSPQEIADSFTSLGLMLDKPIENQVLDLEHRMDRSDWLSIIGCARDLAAFEQLKLKLPPFQTKPCLPSTEETLVNIRVETKLVRRFNTRVFKNIQVKPSPTWLKNRLEAYGIPSINNIVDITNFVMVEYGQPMHAQDLNKFDLREIVLRQAREGETITTLLGETVKLNPQAFVLSQNDKAIVIGGIVGGLKTGVTSKTTEIILDAGNYDQRAIRRISRQLKIQNETVARYDKFLHPKLTEVALNRATYLILKLAGGQCYQNIDYYPKPVPPQTKTLRLSRLKQISGLNFPLNKTKRILLDLDYQIVSETNDQLEVEIPYFRTDVQVEDDLVADILRINGYQKLPTSFLSSPPPIDITPSIYLFSQKLTQLLVAMGLHQHITESLVAKTDHQNQVVLANALTSEKSALRLSLIETLAQVSSTYQKHGLKNLGIFEIGFVYRQLKPNPQNLKDFQETRTLALLIANPTRSKLETSQQLRSYLSRIFQSLKLDPLYHRLSNSRVEIKIDSQSIGWLEFDRAEINLELLHQLANSFQFPLTSEVANLPKENLSLILNLDLEFGPILKQLQQALSPELQTLKVLEEYSDKNLNSQNQKSILLEISYASPKTMSKTRQKIITFFKKHQVFLKS